MDMTSVKESEKKPFLGLILFFMNAKTRCTRVYYN